MTEEEGAYSMSVKHFLMASNSVCTQQPLRTARSALHINEHSGPPAPAENTVGQNKTQHCAKLSLIYSLLGFG